MSNVIKGEAVEVVYAGKTIGTAERIADGARGTPRYLVTAGNETRQIEVVSDLEWTGRFKARAGAHVAEEAYRLGFPARFLVCFTGDWKA